MIAIGDKLKTQGVDDPALQEGVARALVNKGVTLGELKRSEEAKPAAPAVPPRQEVLLEEIRDLLKKNS